MSASTLSHLYAAPQYVGTGYEYSTGGIGRFWPYKAVDMYDRGYGFRRNRIPRTRVNKGKREGPGLLIAPALFLAALFYQSTYSLKEDDHAVF
jgi:hypothetical protein